MSPTPAASPLDPSADPLVVAGRTYRSRLLVGTGKYRDLEETRLAVEASGAEIVTVAVRRTNIGQNTGEPSLLDVLPPDRYTILPNTAGCYDAETAVRTCRLARELLDGHSLVKLEVLGDPKTLFPDVVQTLAAGTYPMRARALTGPSAVSTTSTSGHSSASMNRRFSRASSSSSTSKARMVAAMAPKVTGCTAR